MKAHYLVCYDIAKPKRLGRVLRFMKGRGIHLQYSVFYCYLNWQELADVKVKLSCIIKHNADDVRIYPLPSDALVIAMGCGDRLPEGASIFID
jgi:CRISPR-associated protein Cas2